MQLTDLWGCNHRALSLHHVLRTGEGSSQVFMCYAHLMGESDDILLLLLPIKYRESSSWEFVRIVMRCIEEWCGAEIPPRISCFKLSIYSWYFKAIFRKTPYFDCGGNKSTLEKVSYDDCELNMHSMLLYPSEHFPWPVTSTCYSLRLKSMLVQPKAKETKETHCWCCKLCCQKKIVSKAMSCSHLSF